MAKHPVFAMPFARIYPMYVQKAERKGRTKQEVDQILCWLLGYDAAGLREQIKLANDLETFMAQAPAFHRNAKLITGTVCGIRVEEVEDPLMKKLRQMDKLIDELAQGRAMEKILRQPQAPSAKTPAAAPATAPSKKRTTRAKAAKGRSQARSK